MMTDEAAVRDRLEAWARAVRGRDLAGIVARHAEDIVYFDVPPPVLVRGIREYGRSWPPFLGYIGASGQFDLDDLVVTAGSEVAFAHAILVVRGEQEAAPGRVRLTVGLRKVDGEWIVMHEHHSAPFERRTGREVRVERIFSAERERVWRAYTDPVLVEQWWGRGHALVIERMDVMRGGRWRFVEHAADGTHGFEGRYREVTPPERLEYTFDWDGNPGHVVVDAVTFEDLGDGRTRVVSTSLFCTAEDRDGMLKAGMEQGLADAHTALDALLARAS